MVGPNLGSNPPRNFMSSSPESTPALTPQRCLTSDEGVTEDILSHRKEQYADTFPSYSSSPIRFQKDRREIRNGKANRRRTAHRDDSAMKIRGGDEEMEKFIMQNERKRELHNLKLQAEEHAIPMDEVEKFESEYREEAEDKELLDYVAKREQCEKELDQMLADLLIT